jgi:hypothetical protein
VELKGSGRILGMEFEELMAEDGLKEIAPALVKVERSSE